MPEPAAPADRVPVGRPTAPRTSAAGSQQSVTLTAALTEVRDAAYGIPNLSGGREVRTGRTIPVVTSHDHAVRLGQVRHASVGQVSQVGAVIKARRHAKHVEAFARAAPARCWSSRALPGMRRDLPWT